MEPLGRKKRANLRDVAKAAGVSVATVSRVLNTPGKVRTETRQRIEGIISDLGFVRSAAARAINTGRTKILGALIPTLDSDIFAQTIDAIENRLTDHGFSLVVATTDDDEDKAARKAQELLDIGVEGLFLSGISHNDTLHGLISWAKIPAVAISYYDPGYHLPTIGYDNTEAARQAFEFLVSLGHRRIAVLHGPPAQNDRTRARLRGTEGAPQEVDVTRYATDLSIAGGSRAVADIFHDGAQFDALLCLSDVLAYGAIYELHRRGVEVPKDVSIMGMQDMPASRMLYPTLSTIRLPAQDMGAQAAEALARWVETDEAPKPTSLATELIVRESTSSRS